MMDRAEAERIKEEMQAEWETEIVSTILLHLRGDTDLRADVDKALQPWSEKWNEILELERSVRRGDGS